MNWRIFSLVARLKLTKRTLAVEVILRICRPDVPFVDHFAYSKFMNIK